MLDLEDVDTVYMACGFTDLRKIIDGSVLVVQNDLNLDIFEKVIFEFCNRQQNRLKNLHFDEGFYLYYHRIENNKLKWPMTKN